ncbi:MAG: ACT domain-containing protein [Myxococcales bacterium]|nr:ACT domain-containing protein [Myxococcales bacterium]
MADTRVLVSGSLSDATVEAVPRRSSITVERRPELVGEALLSALTQYDGWLVPPGFVVDEAHLDAARSLRVLGVLGADATAVDVLAASRRGVVVMHAPAGSALAAAEHSLFLLGALARHIPAAASAARLGADATRVGPGRELSGATLGVVGFGHVGRLIADRARGLHLHVLASDPDLDDELAEELGVERVEFDDLLARADFVSVQVPSTPATRGLFGASTFAKMKSDALLVSTARGDVLDRDALLHALESGKIAGAALDVEDPSDCSAKLLERALCTPHVAGDTREARARIETRALTQVLSYLEDGTIEGAVNVPNVPVGGAESLAPYLEIARRLGSLLAQLEEADPREVRVTCSGEAGRLGVSPVAHAVLAGFYSRRLGETIHPVRAPHEAEQRGVEVVEVREMSSRYAATVRVSVTSNDGVHTATGALGTRGEPRLVGLEGYEIDAAMTGAALLMKNEDRPGVIGAVGSLLGERGINVARMQVGLDEESGRALALWMVDGAVPEDALQALRALPHVESVRGVTI